MAQSRAQTKYMNFGEGGTAAAFGVLAVLSIVIAARAYTPEYAFHACLFAAGSVAAIFAIVNRYFERPLDPVPLTIDGKPAQELSVARVPCGTGTALKGSLPEIAKYEGVSKSTVARDLQRARERS